MPGRDGHAEPRSCSTLRTLATRVTKRRRPKLAMVASARRDSQRSGVTVGPQGPFDTVEKTSFDASLTKAGWPAPQ